MLHKRFGECNLALHEEKTKVVYCNDSRYPLEHPYKAFDFLGFTFRDRWVFNPTTKIMFLGFNPGVSKTAVKSMRARTREMNIRNRTDLGLEEIARFFNPILRGWLEYYGLFSKHALDAVLRHVNLSLISWLMRKHKNLKRRKTKAARIMRSISEKQPELFAHWKQGIPGLFA
jgi:RNA-directed DNA polymerase